MEIGNKIKFLRRKAGLTQEQLGERLNISAQSVSKWETGTAMPDITLLPLLSREFGVTIDELFDVTQEDRLQRIEKRMEVEEELPIDIFREFEDYLKNMLAENKERVKCLELLAQLYHHRMEADSRRVSRYAREAIMLHPEGRDCQWLLQKAEGHAVWDWNCAHHTAAIEFYKEVIAADTGEPPTPMPYYYLIDNLLADRRTQEAQHYMEIMEKLPACNPVLVPTYRAHIALIEKGLPEADQIMEEAVQKLQENPGMLFEAAQYYAFTCRYDKALMLYEEAWAREEAHHKPRYTDALSAMAIIHEIRGDLESAVKSQERLLDCLKNEWGYTDEAPVQETLREIQRLQKKMEK